jgi:hypothetical protein
MKKNSKTSAGLLLPSKQKLGTQEVPKIQPIHRKIRSHMNVKLPSMSKWKHS